MFLRLHRPGRPLGRFVEPVTYHREYQPHSKERLLPDGAVELVADLDDVLCRATA